MSQLEVNPVLTDDGWRPWQSYWTASEDVATFLGPVVLEGCVLSRGDLYAPVKIAPRLVYLLRALLICRPGYVTERVLVRIGCDKPCAPYGSLRCYITKLRQAFATLGEPVSIDRVFEFSGVGYVLRLAVEDRGGLLVDARYKRFPRFV